MKTYIIGSITLVFTLLLFACGGEAGQEQTAPKSKSAQDKGASLFKAKCAICHAMTTDIAGPALKDVIARWDNDTTKLKSFIKDSQEMVKSGEPHAVVTYEKYKTTMPSFPSFTDEELSQLIAFLKN